MAAFTRWVLAHRRLVTVFWVLVTLIGMASAGSATKALKQKFSVPSKEGWTTNVAIATHYRGTGGNAAPPARASASSCWRSPPAHAVPKRSAPEADRTHTGSIPRLPKVAA